MGKLHKIRKAFEQLDESVKKDMARSCYNYGVSFDGNGRAIICESVGVFGCRHFVNGERINYKTGEGAHKHKFRYFFPYLRALLVRYGYKKRNPKPYTRTQKMRVKYIGYRPKYLAST